MAKKTRFTTLRRQQHWYDTHRKSIESGCYEPFWRVEDVNSSGIKVKIKAFDDPERVIHLLSINELFMYLLIAWDESIPQCYEQYALPVKFTVAIADDLEIAHPIYSDTRIPRVQTIDFMCERDDGTSIAFLVKQEEELDNMRTAETLAIQQSYCAIHDIDCQIVSSKELKNEWSQNLERLYRHAELDTLLEKVFRGWFSNFVGAMSDDRHERVANVLDQSAITTGIPYARAAKFFYHAIWSGLLTFNWYRPLALEFACSELELYPCD